MLERVSAPSVPVEEKINDPAIQRDLFVRHLSGNSMERHSVVIEAIARPDPASVDGREPSDQKSLRAAWSQARNSLIGLVALPERDEHTRNEVRRRNGLELIKERGVERKPARITT